MLKSKVLTVKREPSKRSEPKRRIDHIDRIDRLFALAVTMEIAEKIGGKLPPSDGFMVQCDPRKPLEHGKWAAFQFENESGRWYFGKITTKHPTKTKDVLIEVWIRNHFEPAMRCPPSWLYSVSGVQTVHNL